MRTTTRAVLAYVVFQAISQVSSAPSTIDSVQHPIVDLGYARYQGSLNSTSNTTNFLAVRYAAAPVDKLRWAAPQAPPHTSGIQQANSQPNFCRQPPTTFGVAGTNPYTPAKLNNTLERRDNSSTDPVNDEDCLFLNIYTPGTALNASLPVVVWIYGGGYLVGKGDGAYGPDVVRESGYGAVVVVVQYRLGIYGFLAGEAVKNAGGLNAGLLDQNFALQWVQKHIHSFGGDPSKVTIWGVSAGAGGVLQQVVAHGGKTEPPLFRAAITSSPYVPSQYNYNDPIPELIYDKVVSLSNCTSSNNTFSCLRGASADTLDSAGATLNLAGFFGTFTFVPVVDGTFIVERPSQTLNKGNHNGDILLAVTSTFEGRVFVNATDAQLLFATTPGGALPPNVTSPDTSNITEYITQLFPSLPPAQAQNATQYYAQLGGTGEEQAIAIMGESIIVCPAYWLLGAYKPGTLWKGEFAVPPGGHASDLPYYFPTSNGPPVYNNPTFLAAFSESFTSVIRFLNPNKKWDPTNITPEWKTWDQGHPEMVFNRTEDGQPDVHVVPSDPQLLERCAFWNSVSNYTSQ